MSIAQQISSALAWRDAHVDIRTVLQNVDPEFRAVRPQGVPYSPWQLLEHMRIAQEDILDFTFGDSYTEVSWPDDYWPANPAPPTVMAWEESVQRFLHDLGELRRSITDSNLISIARHGREQTVLREVLLVLDHNAHHLGQMILILKIAGAWKSAGSGSVTVS